MIARCSRVCGMTPSSAAIDQHHEIDAGGAGQHVVHEPSWPGTSTKPTIVAARARPVGKAQVDRDAARLFLLEPIGVDAGQLADQRGLAVIDVAGGADDHGAGLLARGAAGAALGFAALLGRAARRARHCRSGRRICCRSVRALQPSERRDGIARRRRRPDDARRRASPARRRRRARRPCATIAGRVGVALDAQRVVIQQAEPRHGRGNALRRGLARPARAPPCSRACDGSPSVSIQRQHVLGVRHRPAWRHGRYHSSAIARVGRAMPSPLK